MFDFKVQRQFLDSTSSASLALHIDDEAEYLLLPSRGYFYPVPYNRKKIKIKKMSYQEEHLLTTLSYYQQDIIFEEILKSVVVDDFPSEILVDIDKKAIIVWLRIAAYGQHYSVHSKCLGCSKKNQITWNLGDIAMPDFLPEQEKQLSLKQSITITLPVSNAICEITCPSLYKEQIVEEKMKLKLSYKTKMFASIVSIKHSNITITELEDVYNWFTTNKITLTDSRYIQNEIKKIDFEIKLPIVERCSDCGNTETFHLPFNKYFFGLDVHSYRDYLDKSINFLTFWGKLSYDSAIKMPVAKRRAWLELTSENLKALFPKPK